MDINQPFQPLVSVVIPTYNQSSLLKKTIHSVLEQTYSNTEIIIVDDGSSDDTKNVVQNFIKSHGDKIVYKQQQNKGTPAARNTGWRSAQGELVATLDHDDLWLPQKLERQIPVFEDPKVGMSHAAVHFFFEQNGEKIVTSTGYSGTDWNPHDSENFIVDGGIITVPQIDIDVHDVLSRTVLCTQTFMFRRTTLEEINGFDENLKGTDDWDICIRIADRYKIVGVPQVLALARHHPSQQSCNYRHMLQNEMKLIRKNCNLHPNCKECRAASRKAELLARESCYHEIKVAIKREISKKRILQALLLVAEAFKVNPSALQRIMRRVVKYQCERVLRFARPLWKIK